MTTSSGSDGLTWTMMPFWPWHSRRTRLELGGGAVRVPWIEDTGLKSTLMSTLDPSRPNLITGLRSGWQGPDSPNRR